MTTVADFAKRLKIPAEELLQKMQSADLQAKSADEELTLKDKKALLSALQGTSSSASVVVQSKLIGSGKRKVKVRKISRQSSAPRAVAAASPAPDAVQEPQAATGETPQAAAVPAPQDAAPEEAKTAKQEQEVAVDPAAADAPRDAAARSQPSASPAAAEERSKPVRPGRPAVTERRGSRPVGTEESSRSKARKSPLESKWKSSLSSEKNYQRIIEEAFEREAAKKLPDTRMQRLVLNENNKHIFRKPESSTHRVRIGKNIGLQELAEQLSLKKELVMRAFAEEGMEVSASSVIDQEFAAVIVEKLGHTPVLESALSAKERLLSQLDSKGVSQPRPPVVTVMGHVDHGKTTLLDTLRKSKTAAQEAGGITQHIGAYRVRLQGKEITFLDTPGHVAFSAMRARGAQLTDIVILVVAADDGIMPQTEEALQHIQSAGVPVIVAVNKMDKPGADFEKIQTALSARGLMPEKWGGDVQFIAISALKGDGVNELLEAVLLQAEVLELQAPLEAPARGVIIEARLDKGRGPVVTLLVQQGCLKKGDILVVGDCSGRVRVMSDEHGARVVEAPPSTPVEVQGFSKVIDVGLPFLAVSTDKQARELINAHGEEHRAAAAEARAREEAEAMEARIARTEEESEDEKSEILALFGKISEADKKAVHLVVKADVQGSLEALLSALPQLESEEVKVRISASGIGAITETDVNLAVATDAMILGFNVRTDSAAARAVEANKIELRYYNVIYKLLDDIKEVVQGLAVPEVREKIIGLAEVRETFKSPKFGLVAGCFVEQGAVRRALPVRVLRDGVVIHEGKLSSLRRFKDDVGEVNQGTECGIGVRNYSNVRIGDRIEVFEEVA